MAFIACHRVVGDPLQRDTTQIGRQRIDGRIVVGHRGWDCSTEPFLEFARQTDRLYGIEAELTEGRTWIDRGGRPSRVSRQTHRQPCHDLGVRLAGGYGRRRHRHGRRPLHDHIECTVHEIVSASLPLHFSARGAWQCGGANKHHRCRRDLVLLCHGFTYGADNGLVIGAHEFARQFHDYDQRFFGVALDADGDTMTTNQPRVRGAYGGLDVVRVQIASADDDQIFATTRDEEMAVGEHAEITGAIVVGPIIVMQSCSERVGRSLGVVPISLRDAWAGHPDLPFRAIGADVARVRIDDADTRTIPGVSTAHQFAAVMPMEGRSGAGPLNRHEQYRLGHAIARLYLLRAQPADRERVCKPTDGLGPHWLCAVVRHRPRGEVQRRALVSG